MLPLHEGAEANTNKAVYYKRIIPVGVNIMIFRMLMVLSVLFMVTACSSKEDADVGEVVVHQEPVSTFEDDMYADPSLSMQDTMMPGTPEYFVANVGDRVFFGYDRYDLTAEAQRTLEMQAEWLNQHPGFNVIVEGHCDERGTREYNLALGERRANSVKSYLIALGVSPDRVETVSWGKERPAIDGTGPAVWAQNRRSVTKIQ
jgi:peptidoglycan-associated lipoprotein